MRHLPEHKHVYFWVKRTQRAKWSRFSKKNFFSKNCISLASITLIYCTVRRLQELHDLTFPKPLPHPFSTPQPTRLFPFRSPFPTQPRSPLCSPEAGRQWSLEDLNWIFPLGEGVPHFLSSNNAGKAEQERLLHLKTWTCNNDPKAPKWKCHNIREIILKAAKKALRTKPSILFVTVLRKESLCSHIPMDGWLQPLSEAWLECLMFSQPSRSPPGQLQQNLLQFFTLLRSDRVTVLTDTSCKRLLKLGAPTTHICFKCQPDNMGLTGQNPLVCALQEVKS